METKEKIVLGIGFLALIGILIYPPVTLDGFSPTFEKEYKYGSFADVFVTKDDYGYSDEHKINWTDSRRRFIFQSDIFDEKIVIYEVSGNTSEKSAPKEFVGLIEWSSEINIGKLLIQVLLVIVVTAGVIFLIRI